MGILSLQEKEEITRLKDTEKQLQNPGLNLQTHTLPLEKANFKL